MNLQNNQKLNRNNNNLLNTKKICQDKLEKADKKIAAPMEGTAM